MLRTMLQVRKIHVQEDLNAVVVRDQPDVIRLARKLIEANDRGDSEVVFDLELIEVNHNDTRDLGLKMSTYTVGAGLSLPGSNKIVDSVLGTSTNNLVPMKKGINPFGDLDSFYTLPNATFRFVKTLVDAEILASPKIRVKNNEKAKVHVGSREPVITVTTNNGVTSDNIQYVDVGVKLDVEPKIQLDNTIITKLGLEVSNVSGRETTSSGTAVITISSTNATTTLTLKDGEQTIIGGLIRNDKSTTKNKVPILGDLPLVGELFNGTKKTDAKREILLSITPHIVKAVQVPNGDSARIWSGGEDDLKYGRNFGTFVEEYQLGQEIPLVDKGSAHVAEQDDVDLDVPSAVMTPRSVDAKPALKEGGEGRGTPSLSKNIEEVIPVTPLKQNELIPVVFLEGPQSIQSGKEIVVKVNVENTMDLYSAPLTFQYDPTKLFFIGATEGKLLETVGQSAVFDQTAMSDKGKVFIAIKVANKTAAISGSGELCSLKFKAVDFGNTVVKVVQADFLNMKKQEVKTTWFEYPVRINP